MDDFECLGQWWLPGAEDAVVGGLLRWSQADGLMLELAGTFGRDTSEFFAPDRIDEYPIVFGATNRPGAKTITLVDCLVVSETHAIAKMIPSGFDYQHLDVLSGALLGTHATRAKEERFSSVSFTVDHLAEWASAPGVATVPEAKISLAIGPAPTGVGDAGTTRNFRITVDVAAPLTWAELARRYVAPIQNLVASAVNQPVDVDRIQLQPPIAPDEGGRDRPFVTLLRQGRPFTAVPKDRALWPHDMLFMLGEAPGGWASLVPKWIELCDEVGDALNLYFANVYAPPAYVEARFLVMIQAIEIYHRQRNPGVPSDAHKKRMKAIKKGCPEYWPWLARNLSNSWEPSLKVRLEELVDECEPVFAPLIGADTRAFVRTVVDSRNHYTHWSQPSKPSVARRGAELLWLSHRLSFLFAACLMIELGFDIETCHELMARNRLFQRIRDLPAAE